MLSGLGNLEAWKHYGDMPELLRSRPSRACSSLPQYDAMNQNRDRPVRMGNGPWGISSTTFHEPFSDAEAGPSSVSTKVDAGSYQTSQPKVPNLIGRYVPACSVAQCLSDVIRILLLR